MKIRAVLLWLMLMPIIIFIDTICFIVGIFSRDVRQLYIHKFYGKDNEMGKLFIDGKEIQPFEPFLCMEDNERFERFVLEVNDTKIPVYIRPSDFKKLRGE